MVALAKRDVLLLTDIFRCRVLSEEQLMELGKSRGYKSIKHMLERLRKLVENNILVCKQVVVFGKRTRVYGLTSEYLVAFFGFSKQRNIPSSSSLLHYLTTNDYYVYALSDKERATWCIQDDIIGEDEKPDAIYISNEGEKVFVETETGNYSKQILNRKEVSWRGKRVIWLRG